jgi:hypothetical protein
LTDGEEGAATADLELPSAPDWFFANLLLFALSIVSSATEGLDFEALAPAQQVSYQNLQTIRAGQEDL